MSRKQLLLDKEIEPQIDPANLQKLQVRWNYNSRNTTMDTKGNRKQDQRKKTVIMRVLHDSKGLSLVRAHRECCQQDNHPQIPNLLGPWTWTYSAMWAILFSSSSQDTFSFEQSLLVPSLIHLFSHLRSRHLASTPQPSCLLKQMQSNTTLVSKPWLPSSCWWLSCRCRLRLPPSPEQPASAGWEVQGRCMDPEPAKHELILIDNIGL